MAGRPDGPIEDGDFAGERRAAQLNVTADGTVTSASAGAGRCFGMPTGELAEESLPSLSRAGRLADGTDELLSAVEVAAEKHGEPGEHGDDGGAEPAPVRIAVRPASDAPPREVAVTVRGTEDGTRATLRLAERGLPASPAAVLDRLEAATAALASVTDVERVDETLAAGVVSVLGATGVDVRWSTDGGSGLERAACGQGPAVDERTTVDATTPPYGEVWPAGETLLAAEAVDGVHPGYDGVLLAPIGTHGTVAVGRVGRTITAADVDAVGVMVEHAAGALTAARNRETLDSQRAALGRYETLVEAIPDPVYATDERGQVTFVNRAFERVFGYDPAEGASHFSEFTTPESAARFREEISDIVAAADQPYAELGLTGVTDDGRQRRLEASLGVIAHDTDFDGVAGVLRDVTQRERRDEVATVLQRALRHNLRTSIDVIDAHAGMTAEAVEDDEVTGHLELVRQEAAWLLKLGETLRKLQRAIDPGRAPTETVPVEDVLQPVVDEYRRRYPAADIEVHYAVEGSVPGPSILAHAIANVVENAIVHNDGDEPSVGIWAAHGPETGWVDIHVEDDGPGIPARERDILLGEVEITQLQHGSGIGLWITRWIVDALDGELLIETAEGRDAEADDGPVAETDDGEDAETDDGADAETADGVVGETDDGGTVVTLRLPSRHG